MAITSESGTSSDSSAGRLTPRARGIRRIVVEAVVVAFLGAMALGIFWEMNLQEIGWVVAIVIWVAGAPALEILRVLQSRNSVK